MALRRLGDPAPMRDLAATLGCDASYVTGLADGLERLGLVARVVDPADRRVKQLVLTEPGRVLRERLIEAIWTDHPLSNLDEGERDALAGALARLASGDAGACTAAETMATGGATEEDAAAHVP